MDLGTLMPYVLPIATIAAAWGGTRQALNGTRERVRSIDEKLDQFKETYHHKHENVVTRVAVVEAKIDGLRCKIKE